MTEILENLISVVAISENNAIAKDGRIPWEYPADKRQYKQRTWGESILVGRVTYEAFCTYQSDYIESCDVAVLTSDSDYEPAFDKHRTVKSVDAAIEWVNSVDEVVYNLGGGTVYQQFFDMTAKLIVSHIPVTVTNPTVFFPTIDDETWTVSTVESYGSFEVVTYSRTQ